MKYWNVEKGFGFIRPEDGEDVFVHSTSICGSDKLDLGDVVSFEMKHNNETGKQKAVKCRIVTSDAKKEVLKGQRPQVVGSTPMASAATTSTALDTKAVPSSKCEDESMAWLIEVIHETESEESESETEESDSDESDLEEVEVQIPQSEELVLPPSEVFFTHDQISKQFRNGYGLDQAIDDIAMEVLSFDDFPPPICTKYHGCIFSLSNRRLFVARVLEQLGKLPAIRIHILPWEHRYLQRNCQFTGMTKWESAFSTRVGGKFVRVKSTYEFSQSNDDLTKECMRRQKTQEKPLKTQEKPLKDAAKPLKSVCIFPTGNSLRSIKTAEGRLSMQEVQWHFEESLPKEILNKLAKVYGIGWEIFPHPRDYRQLAIKVRPISFSTASLFKEGYNAIRQALAMKYQFKEGRRFKATKTLQSLDTRGSLSTLSTEEKRAAEKKKTLERKRLLRDKRRR